MGLAQPDEEHITSFRELAKKAREGSKIPLRDVKDLARKEPLTTLPHTAGLMKAVETFGSGVHRIVVVKEGTSKVVGILSQSRLVKFLWENGRSFPVIDQLYPQYLRDLRIGSQQVIAIKYVLYLVMECPLRRGGANRYPQWRQTSLQRSRAHEQ